MISGDFGNILANGKEGVNEWGKVRKIYGRKVLLYAALVPPCYQCLHTMYLSRDFFSGIRSRGRWR